MVALGTGPTTMQGLVGKRTLQHGENTVPCFCIHHPVRQQHQVLHAIVLCSLGRPTLLKTHSPFAPANLYWDHPQLNTHTAKRVLFNSPPTTQQESDAQRDLPVIQPIATSQSKILDTSSTSCAQTPLVDLPVSANTRSKTAKKS